MSRKDRESTADLEARLAIVNSNYEKLKIANDARIEAAVRSCRSIAREAVLPLEDRNSATPAMHKAIETTCEVLAPALAKRDARVRQVAVEECMRRLRELGHSHAANVIAAQVTR